MQGNAGFEKQYKTKQNKPQEDKPRFAGKTWKRGDKRNTEGSKSF